MTVVLVQCWYPSKEKQGMDLQMPIVYNIVEWLISFNPLPFLSPHPPFQAPQPFRNTSLTPWNSMEGFSCEAPENLPAPIAACAAA